MKNRVKSMVFGLVLLFSGVMATGTVAAAGAAPSACQSGDNACQQVQQCKKADFFGLIPWYNYIGNELDNSSGQCEVKCFNILDQGSKPNDCGQTKSDIPLVLMAIIDDLLRIAGLVGTGFVVFGAFQYTSSQGNPDKTAKAQSTIINALIGVAIAVVAVGFVSFLGDQLGH